MPITKADGAAKIAEKIICAIVCEREPELRSAAMRLAMNSGFDAMIRDLHLNAAFHIKPTWRVIRENVITYNAVPHFSDIAFTRNHPLRVPDTELPLLLEAMREVWEQLMFDRVYDDVQEMDENELADRGGYLNALQDALQKVLTVKMEILGSRTARMQERINQSELVAMFAAEDDDSNRLAWPWPEADQAVGRSLTRGESFGFWGGTGTGKTFFLLQFVVQACASGLVALFHSSEMPVDQTRSRIVNIICHLETGMAVRASETSEEHRARVRDAFELLRSWETGEGMPDGRPRLYIVSGAATGDANLRRISHIRSLAALNKVDLLAVDAAYFVIPTRIGKNAQRYEELMLAADELKATALDLNIMVMSAYQTNISEERKNKDRYTPGYMFIQGSKQLVNSVDYGVWLVDDQTEPDTLRVSVNIEKGRSVVRRKPGFVLKARSDEIYALQYDADSERFVRVDVMEREKMREQNKKDMDKQRRALDDALNKKMAEAKRNEDIRRQLQQVVQQNAEHDEILRNATSPLGSIEDNLAGAGIDGAENGE